MKGGPKNCSELSKNEPKRRPTLSHEWDTERGKASSDAIWEKFFQSSLITSLGFSTV